MVVINEWYPSDKLSILKYVEEQKVLSGIYKHAGDTLIDGKSSKDLSPSLPVSLIYELPRKKSMTACIDECIEDTKQNLRESEEMAVKMAELHLELENIDKINYFMEPLKVGTIVKSSNKIDISRNNESCLSVVKRVSQLEDSPTVVRLADVKKLPTFERKLKKIALPQNIKKLEKVVQKSQSFMDLKSPVEAQRSFQKSHSLTKSKPAPLNIQAMLQEAKEKYRKNYFDTNKIKIPIPIIDLKLI
ncbi:unnamed protein product [Diamesa tonsa]